MSKNLWTRDEEIIVFNLYCKIPFAKSSKFHPEVIEIAELIGRTPSAVNMKIGNFGRMDPELKKKNISELTNGSRLDEEIWEEFHNNWDKLAFESEELINRLKGINEDNTEVWPMGEEKEKMVKARMNQNFFRRAVMSSYGCCCITGLKTNDLLIARHIKPWRDCSPDDKTNPRNGLCLNALHDKAFDKGYITITPELKIIISKKLDDIYEGKVVERYFYAYEGKQIIIPERFFPEKQFLEYHNDVIFQK